MPKGNPKYFKQLDPYAGYISVDDPEFLGQVRSKIGDSDKDLVQEGMFQNIGDKNTRGNILGVNLSRTPENKRVAAAENVGLGSLDPSKPYVGVGAGASPQTFAHEARHTRIKDEADNRMADLISSNSLAQYKSNINSVYESLFPNSAIEEMTAVETGAQKSIPFAKREAKIISHIIQNKPLHSIYNIRKHIDINRGEPSNLVEFTTSPMEYITGDRPVGEHGPLVRSTYKERVKYPFLNFVGYAAREERTDKPKNKKYNGGSIENTTNYGKLI